jgi:hypothetical protein
VQIDDDLSFIRQIRESANTVEEAKADMRNTGMEKGWNSLRLISQFHSKLKDLGNDASTAAATWKSMGSILSLSRSVFSLRLFGILTARIGYD